MTGRYLKGALIIALASLLLLEVAAPAMIASVKVSAASEPLRTKKLEFEMLSLSWFTQSDVAAEVIAQQLAKVGIKVDLKRVESSIMYPKVQNFEFQAYALATSQSPNPINMIDTFHSKYCQPGVGSYWCCDDPVVDKMIEAMRSASSMDEAKRIAVEIQERLAAESGFIPVYLTQSVKVVRAEWKNYTVMPGGLVEVFDIWSMLYMYKSDVPAENIFKIAFPSDVLTLNPFMATDLRSLWVINLVYDPLFRLDPNMNIVPWLAESWSTSSNGTVYTITLRSGVRWHNGQPFTADDVVYTFAEGMRQNTSRYIGLKDVIQSVEKIDDRTVKFVLKRPDAFFIESLATGYYYIVPKRVIENVDLKTWSNDNPIGTGPFKFVQRVVGESVVLEKNGDFWVQGTPRISKVIIKVIPDAQSRFLAIKTGDVDTERYDTLVTLVEQAKRDPNLKLVTAPGIWLVYIAFNTYSYFNDSKVFEAIQYAINRTEVIEKANGGYGYPVYTTLNKYWHNGFAAPIEFPYDPEKAKKILEEAGWVDVDGDGIREYVGPRLTTTVTTGTPETTTTPTPTTTPPAGGVSPAVYAIIVIIILAIIAAVILKRK